MYFLIYCIGTDIIFHMHMFNIWRKMISHQVGVDLNKRVSEHVPLFLYICEWH